MTTNTILQEYAAAVAGLLAHGGYERTGDANEAKRWDIDHVVTYLNEAGRPDARHTVHIAGSKGKGSVATMVDSILRASGEHTLLLTSPDLHEARERIRIDGTTVAYTEFTALANRLLADPAAANWSYFELLTMMGWFAGAQNSCTWQILEVGLGGRLDTTNAVSSKEVAVITPIDLEHTSILGNTIPQIAAEKAGIINGPSDVVVAPMRESALDVIRSHSAKMAATLHSVTEKCALRVTSQNLAGQHLDLKTPVRTYRGLRLPLVGPHQAENAAVAVLASELALANVDKELSKSAVEKGLATVNFRGRFEILEQNPVIILDGLHTPLAAKRFRETLATLSLPSTRVFVVGLLSGKEILGIADALVLEGDTVIVVAPATSRSAVPREVSKAFTQVGAVTQEAQNIPDAIDLARSTAGEQGVVFVVGSLYTVSEARELLLGVTGDRGLGLR